MIKGGINFVMIGMGIIILTAYMYYSENEEKITNKFVLSVNKSYLFNWTPMIGLSFIVFGEFILWETQNNNKLKELKAKLLNDSRLRLSEIMPDLLNSFNKNF